MGLVGAIRLAEPNSFWATRFYDADKLERSRERYPDHVEPGAAIDELAHRQKHLRVSAIGTQTAPREDERQGAGAVAVDRPRQALLAGGRSFEVGFGHGA